MLPMHHQPIPRSPAAALSQAGALSPAMMAQTLRQAGGAAALCFAQAMHDKAAWANEAWGEYWAEVVRAV